MCPPYNRNVSEGPTRMTPSEAFGENMSAALPPCASD